MAKAIKLHRLLPLKNKAVVQGSICNRCCSINKSAHNFCTNCGWPVKETNQLLSLYNLRARHRKDLLQQYAKAILTARVVLYIIGALCLSGIGFLFSENDERYFLFIVTVIMAALFVLLARWSLYKPFTSLLVSFVVIITFSTISVFGRLIQAVTIINGLYTILFSVVVTYFLLRGIQAAYKADIINEEIEIA